MAIVYSYSKVTTPLDTDVLLLTDTTVTAGKRKNKTKSIAMSDVAAYVLSTPTAAITGSGTQNTFPIFTSSKVLGDSIITQSSNAAGVVVTGGLTVSEDANFQNDITTGSLEVTNVSTFGSNVNFNNADVNVNNTSTLVVSGPLKDNSGGVGTSGQVLSSTVTGVSWVNAGGNPAGSDTQLQYNNGGAFGAITGATFDDTNGRLYLDTTRVIIGGSSSFQNGLTVNDPTEFRNVVEFADGSATSPSITFWNTGDDNTGIFRPANDIIAFATGGSEEFRIGANGEIGLSGANFGTSGQVLTSNGTGSGASWTTVGGGGASDLNGLSDCLVDTDSLYIAEVPSGLSGNPQGNTVMGIDAGAALTSGTNNTFVGNDAGLATTTANDNVLVGFQAGKGVTTTSKQNNVAIGSGTFDIAAGQNSVVVGYQAGRVSSVTSGVYIGYQAGWANAGSGNVGVGYEALNGGGGVNSVGIGYQVAKSNTASGHTSLGYQSGFSQTSGPENTNIGYRAGYNNTTNGSRTCIGYQAGQSSTGAWNTLVGSNAGRLITGAGCVAVGRNALLNNTSGGNNIAVGHEAGNWTATGSGNVFVGTAAGRQNSSGSSSTAVGYEALRLNLGSNNTSLGYRAGDSVTTGSNNTIIGYDAAASSATVSNEITLGNSSVATLRCQVQTISSLSDSRDKTNVQPSTYGLDFIDKLSPVTFDWNMRDGAKVGDKDLGFIAQELQEVDDENLQLVYDSNPDRLEASYGRLIPVLVKAIQELKSEVELLKS